jgi:ABC-type nitrate/sulfonate/bicarbonate transport system substrate-binding protein
VVLADADQERVELVEEGGVVRQVRHQEGLDGSGVGVRRNEAVPRQDAPRVGVHDEDRAAGGVERDGVRRFRPDAGDPAELRAEGREGQSQEPREAAPLAPRHVPGEGAQAAGLQPERPGRAQERGQAGPRQREHPAEIEGPRGAEPPDRPLGVAPGGVLREDRSDDDLEARARRPPALRTVPPVEAVVEAKQAATMGSGPASKRRRREHGQAIIRTTAIGRHTGTLGRGLALGGLVLARIVTADPPTVTVSVGGPAEDPAYLPVHAAVALGTFEAEGVQVTLKRVKHPTAAVTALRDREAGIAVTTLDEAIRGAWARKLPVQILVAHMQAPAVALVVSAAARDTVRRVEDLQGKAVGMPGPGTTGHLLLTALLRAARIQPWQLSLRSVGTTALLAQLGTGDLAAAMVEEPWVSRLLDAGRASLLVDLRRPAEVERVIGGPFYEVVSVAAVAAKEKPKETPKSRAGAKKETPPRIEPPPEAALAAYARAVARVQVWLATTRPPAVAERLPPALVGDPARFAARLAAQQPAYAGAGEPSLAGLEATLRVLRGGGSPWPVSLSVDPGDLAPPAGVSAARRQLGAAPPGP